MAAASHILWYASHTPRLMEKIWTIRHNSSACARWGVVGRVAADLCHGLHVEGQAPELAAPTQPAAGRAAHGLADAAGHVLQVLPCKPGASSGRGTPGTPSSAHHDQTDHYTLQ